MKRKIAFGCLVALALLLVAVGFAAFRGSRSESKWTPIETLEELRRPFNRDVDSTRIVLLLSPS